MARYRGPACKRCRREGEKLYLKGERCAGPKCGVERRKYAPGEHGQSRQKMSTYGKQLREKQKAKAIYGLLEAQFRRYFRMAERFRGMTGTILLQLLERRLDNLVYRLGFAPSRRAARQLVGHGHVRVNGRKVDIPSYLVRPGEEISLAEDMKTNAIVAAGLAAAEKREKLPWLACTPETLTGRLLNVPTREEIPLLLNEQMIVELYSK
ncbi:MAG: 30S ribosomal protein S4 [Candidatus Sumerlaeia bacterium]|nr:30S ribosomal protein S4 [Candidatus Sumerlaeia bacterium]